MKKHYMPKPEEQEGMPLHSSLSHHQCNEGSQRLTRGRGFACLDIPHHFRTQGEGEQAASLVYSQRKSDATQSIQSNQGLPIKCKIAIRKVTASKQRLIILLSRITINMWSCLHTITIHVSNGPTYS
jgi:hypothetical protein